MDTIVTPNTSEEDLQIIVDALKVSIPTYDELLKVLEKNKGWLPLNNNFIEFLSKQDTPWCTFYEDKNRLKGLAIHACLGEEVNDETFNNFLEESTESLNLPDTDFNLLKDEYEQASKQNDDLSADKLKKTQQESLQKIYLWITSLFNYLALMVHGRTMCQLITDAKDGDDEAFCLAVQIDRTILQLPCFQQRLLKSQFSNDAIFLNKLASRIRTPILQSKIRYRTLMLAFAMLDEAEVLDGLSHEKLLDICEEIGVTGKENGIDDVDKLRKRLYEYSRITRM